MDLVFAGDGVFDLSDISSWGLLNSEIIFSASLEFISFEEKIISLIKSKINLVIKNVDSKQAEKILSEFNKLEQVQSEGKKSKSLGKDKVKSKKISKK